MSLSLVQQFAPTSVSTYSSGSTVANLGVLTGNLYVSPGGAKVSGDVTANGYGWGIDCQESHSNYQVYWTISGANITSALPNGCYSEFLFIDAVNYDGAHMAQIQSVFQFNGNGICAIFLDPVTGHFFFSVPSSGTNGTASWSANATVDTGIAYPVRQQFELRQAWHNTTGNSYQYSVAMRPRGGSASSWVTLFPPGSATSGGSTSAVVASPQPINYILGGFNNYSGGQTWIRGRVSAPTLCSMGSFADGTALLPSTTDPTRDSGYTWYWDPKNFSGSASDGNDGATSATPFLTVGRYNTLSANEGFFAANTLTAWQTATNGTAGGTPIASGQTAAILNSNTYTLSGGLLYQYLHGQIALTGDTVVVNNANQAEIPLAGASPAIQTDGLTLKSSGGTPAPVWFTLFKPISPSDWTLVSGKTNTYFQTQDVEQDVCIYQNRSPLNHPSGANYSAVASALEGTAGSMFVDSSGSAPTAYLHPLNSTNPAGDGNRYERTQYLNGGTNGINVTAANFIIQGINVSGTTLVDMSNNQVQGYCFQQNCLSNSLGVFDTCAGDYYSKHCFGNVNGNYSNNATLTIHPRFQRGTPYTQNGGPTALVDQNGGSSGTGNQSAYYNVSSGQGGAQAIGSPNPVTDNGQSVWTHHGIAYQGIWFIGGDTALSGGLFNQLSTPLVVAGMKLAAGIISNPTDSFYRCNVVNYQQSVGTFNNCLVNTGTLGNLNVTGATLSFVSSTLDYSAVPSGTWMKGSTGNGTNVIHLKDCLLIPGPNIFYQLNNSGDTYGSTNCVICSASGANYLNNVSGAYATLAQAQADGLDSGSAVTGGSLPVDSLTYVPTSQTPITDNQGVAADFSGTLFARRQTIGAYEYVSSAGVGGGGGNFAGNYGNFATAGNVQGNYGNFNA